LRSLARSYPVARSRKKGLGKGLDALLTTQPRPELAPAPAETVPDEARIYQLDPHAIKPNPRQPRRAFDEETLEELAESIRRDGLQEPVIVRKVGDEYQLVTGERRVRASIMAGSDTVLAICRDVSDADMFRLGLIENIHRDDLNAIELAQAYQALVDEFDWTQEQVAVEVGKNRVTVTNTLRLLNLPPEVQQCVADGSITMGHAKALLALESPKAQSDAARKIIAQGLSVRQAEKLTAPKEPKTKKTGQKDPNIMRIEDELRRCLGTRVNLRTSKPHRGRIEIEYFSLDELERILDILCGK